MGTWVLTRNRVEIYAEDDETWTPNKEVEGYNNNGQMLIPIPHNPGP